MERLQRPDGVNISKGQVRAECVERNHVAAENTGEHRRMLGMKFYITRTYLVGHFPLQSCPSSSLSGHRKYGISGLDMIALLNNFLLLY